MITVHYVEIFFSFVILYYGYTSKRSYIFEG